MYIYIYKTIEDHERKKSFLKKLVKKKKYVLEKSDTKTLF